jgi:hypothetical protein
MTDDRSLERAARSWIENGPTEAPDRAVEAALFQIQTTPQERDLRIPWRLPTMTTPARVAAAAVIGVLVIGGALVVLKPGTSSGIGGPGPSPSPSPTPTASPTLSPSPSVATIVVPAMTTTFTSTRHGFNISYPAGWTATPATESWLSTAPDQAAAFMDRLRGRDALLVVTSKPLGKGETPDIWKAAYVAQFGQDGVGECDVMPPDWPSILIGGREGFLDGNDCTSDSIVASNGRFFEAVVFVDGRVYLFWLDGAVNIEYFRALLETVVFDTAAAID